ncbi:MAG TPA: hypothetical protein DCR87_02335 [Acidobacteria bacterium]|nr:hypothetical protein [Acidobacteriota bacterium]
MAHLFKIITSCIRISGRYLMRGCLYPTNCNNFFLGFLGRSQASAQGWTHIIVALIFFVFALLGTLPQPVEAGSKPPRWLVEISEKPLPTLAPETEAVYLLHEQKLVYSSTGYLIRYGRQAVKILRKEGIEPLKFLVRANTFNTRVRKMNAWVINPDDSKQSYDLKSAISTSLAPDTLYWDVKTLFLYLPEVTRGSLIGYEWEEEVKPISLEDIFIFQHRFPVLQAIYQAEYPKDCQPWLDWINWPESQVVSGARSLTVQLTDIPALKDEPLKPPDEAIAGRLLVRFRTEKTPKYGRFFSDWKDMGLWYEQLSQERRQPDEKVRVKASELVSGLTDLRAQIEKLAAFVQQEVRYVSIQIGIGGYQPHPAPEILANRYGDCKDKATLLAALLSYLNVESYYLIVNIERQVVKDNSPVSLFWFNHAILAIKLPDDKLYDGAEAVVPVPGLGRLLIFDPTMPHSPPGRLPFYLQKNNGLLVAGEQSRLLTFPGSTPERLELVRRGQFVLSADGTLKGSVSETLSGFQAEVARLRLRDVPERNRRKDLENFLARSLGSFNLENYDYLNLDQPEREVELRYSFRAGSYLRRSGDVLSFRPNILALIDDYEILKQKGERKYPLMLPGVGTSRDELEIVLPDGYSLETLPEPMNWSSSFADYHCRLELKGGVLFLERQLRIKEDLLPPSRFQEALEIFRMLSVEERRRLLLKKLNQPE